MKRYVKERLGGVEVYSPVTNDNKVVTGLVLLTILPPESKVVGTIKGWKKGEPIIEWYEKGDIP